MIIDPGHALLPARQPEHENAAMARADGLRHRRQAGARPQGQSRGPSARPRALYHAIGNWREPTRNNGQTRDRQIPEFTGPFKIRTSATTSGYYRTSSPVTALPMIMRWISDVPSKIVKLLEVRAVSAGRPPDDRALVSTNSARYLGHSRLVPVCVIKEARWPLEEGRFCQTARTECRVQADA